AARYRGPYRRTDFAQSRNTWVSGRPSTIKPTHASLATFLESVAASGAQLLSVRLQTFCYRPIVLILRVPTVLEHIRSTSTLLLQGAPVAFCTSFLGQHVGG